MSNFCTFDNEENQRELWLDGKLVGSIDAKYCGHHRQATYQGINQSYYSTSREFRQGLLLGSASAMSDERYAEILNLSVAVSNTTKLRYKV